MRYDVRLSAKVRNEDHTRHIFHLRRYVAWYRSQFIRAGEGMETSCRTSLVDGALMNPQVADQSIMAEKDISGRIGLRVSYAPRT